MLTVLAQAAQTGLAQNSTDVLGKGILVGIGMLGPAIAIGLVGNAYMKAIGRNPESSKYLGQVLVIMAIIELIALLVFASLFII